MMAARPKTTAAKMPKTLADVEQMTAELKMRRQLRERRALKKAQREKWVLMALPALSLMVVVVAEAMNNRALSIVFIDITKSILIYYGLLFLFLKFATGK